MMKPVIDVNTGEVKASKNNAILKSRAIGSCIAVAAYDKKSKVGAIAHIMLPGKAPVNLATNRYRYAYDSVEKLLSLMIYFGAKTEDIEVCITGGGNVLKRKNDTIGFELAESVIEILHKKKLTIKAKSIAGFERRSISLDIEAGDVYYSVGNEQEKLFWKYD